MVSLKNFEHALVLGAALGTGVGAMPAWAASAGSTPDTTTKTTNATLDPAENLMKTLGRLPLPIRLYTNYPKGNEAKKQHFINDLSPNEAARAPLEKLLDMSIAVLDKDSVRIERGAKKESEQDASSDREDIKNLSQATSALAAALNKQPLNYDKAKVHERADTDIHKILTMLPYITKYNIAAYDEAIKTSDYAAAETIKAAFITMRLKETGQNPETAPKGLISALDQELESQRLVWIAMKDVVAVGLDNLDGAPELHKKTSLPLSPVEERYNRSVHGAYLSKANKYSPLLIQAMNGGNQLQNPLQKLEAAQKQLGHALDAEESIVNTRSFSPIPVSPAVMQQMLKRGIPVINLSSSPTYS